MNPDYRQRLLSILSRLDRLTTDANGILADPADTDKVPLAEELRDLIVELQAKVWFVTPSIGDRLR